MLKLGLPSKGRLQEQSIEAFAGFGLSIERIGADREYSGRLAGAPDVRLALMSAGEIPSALASGEIHLGVTGLDLLAERVPDSGLRAPVLAKLGFGHADLIVAVPACWADVETMHDLDEAAADFCARHGRPIRVATKYHQLARRFFAQTGVADYRLVDSQGATEAGPRNLTCEVIVDITSSGETLRANHLRILDDGLILRSEAALALSRSAGWDERSRRALGELGLRLGFDPASYGL